MTFHAILTSSHERPINSRPMPVVIVRNKRAWSTSEDFARVFGREHADVMRDIKALNDGRGLAFLQFDLAARSVSAPEGVPRQERFYYMSREGFDLLTAGITSKRGIARTRRYAEAYDAVKAELDAEAARPPIRPDLVDTMAMGMDMVGLVRAMLQAGGEHITPKTVRGIHDMLNDAMLALNRVRTGNAEAAR